MLRQYLRNIQRLTAAKIYSSTRGLKTGFSNQKAILLEKFKNSPLKFFFAYSILAFPLQKEPQEINKMASSDNLSDVLQHADQLFDENNFEETVKILKGFQNQQEYDVKWRLARALHSLAKENSDDTIKKEMINEAFVTASEAVEIKDDHFAGHKWMAIIFVSKTDYDPFAERVAQVDHFNQYINKAIELNPQDPLIWYFLGLYKFEIANLSWYLKKIVETILTNPPTGTYEEALENFEKAEKFAPNFYSMNLLMIGKCYYWLNDTEKAKEWLTKASEVEVKVADDKKCKEEALALLAQMAPSSWW